MHILLSLFIDSDGFQAVFPSERHFPIGLDGFSACFPSILQHGDGRSASNALST